MVTTASGTRGSYRRKNEPGKAKDFHGTMSESLFDEFEIAAREEGMTMVELMRRFIRLGLTVTTQLKVPGASLVIRVDDRDIFIIV